MNNTIARQVSDGCMSRRLDDRLTKTLYIDVYELRARFLMFHVGMSFVWLTSL
jgi:hypothetical protein